MANLGFFQLSTALKAYRFLAFLTGTVLLLGTIGLLAEALGLTISDSLTSPLWIAHGYLFMVYVLATINLALHMKWSIVRTAFTASAGTIPTASFIAERSVTRRIHESAADNRPMRGL
jgi:integral membrane protein